VCVLSRDMKDIGNEKNCIFRSLEFLFICIYMFIIIIIITQLSFVETTFFLTSSHHGGRPFSINTYIIYSFSDLLNNLFNNARNQ
jgi:hypothetical protein